MQLKSETFILFKNQVLPPSYSLRFVCESSTPSNKSSTKFVRTQIFWYTFDRGLNFFFQQSEQDDTNTLSSFFWRHWNNILAGKHRQNSSGNNNKLAYNTVFVWLSHNNFYLTWSTWNDFDVSFRCAAVSFPLNSAMLCLSHRPTLDWKCSALRAMESEVRFCQGKQFISNESLSRIVLSNQKIPR